MPPFLLGKQGSLDIPNIRYSINYDISKWSYNSSPCRVCG